MIESGELACPACGRRFPVTDGIPRLLPRELARGGEDTADQAKTAAHFANEFTALAEDDRDFDPPDLLAYYFYTRTGLDPLIYTRIPGDFYRTSLPNGPSAYRPDGSFLKGKRVLDAGCGPGRFVPVAAAAAGHVVGLDLGHHIGRAAARCRGLPNVDFVQGSLLAPPFKPGSFDVVYSIGVLHHTPDPAAGCRALAGLLAASSESALSVWVYPPVYWGGRLRGPVNRFVNRRLRGLHPARAIEICGRWLYPLGRLQMALARRRWLKALAAPLFLVSVPRHPKKEVMVATIYDYFGPPIISTHSYDEVEGWLRESGLRELRRLPVPTGLRAQGIPGRAGDE